MAAPTTTVVMQTVRKVAFHNNHDNRYLIAEHGSLGAHHHLGDHSLLWSHGHKGHFHIEQYPGYICLRTSHGKYVAISHHGQLYLADTPANPETALSLEFFPAHNGKFAIRALNATRYIGVHQGRVTAYHEFSPHTLFVEIAV